MRVEAIKVSEGFLIPFKEGLENIESDRIVLDIELLDSPPKAKDYDPLDQLAGLCNTGDENASVEHDNRIYRRSS